MPITINHASLAASVLAASIGTVAIVRSMPTRATEPTPAASIASTPPKPSACKKACDDIAKTCSVGRTMNCEAFFAKAERETDGGVSCADGISASEMASLGVDCLENAK